MNKRELEQNIVTAIRKLNAFDVDVTTYNDKYNKLSNKISEVQKELDNSDNEALDKIRQLIESGQPKSVIIERINNTKIHSELKSRLLDNMESNLYMREYDKYKKKHMKEYNELLDKEYEIKRERERQEEEEKRQKRKLLNTLRKDLKFMSAGEIRDYMEYELDDYISKYLIRMMIKLNERLKDLRNESS